MSLLQNEDFVLYQLRTSYLSHIKDGVGERLITVNSSVLNNPAFRVAGWNAHASDIKRTYSPPIPTAVTSDYFQAPRSAGLSAPTGFGDDDEEGGLVTGGHGSNETVGPSINARRRRRREQLEEDDSSDLSDESDDEDGAQRPVTQIKFQKMPVRNRAGSSPLRSKDGPSLMITSPSRPPESALRRGSLGALEAVKERARRDTVTSSEMSSENEFDASAFQRRTVRPHRPSKAAAANMLSQRIAEDERESEVHLEEIQAEIEAGGESDASSLSSFAGSVDSNLSLGDGHGVTSQPSLRLGLSSIPTGPSNPSPKKSRSGPALLQALPPPRPISMIQPVSALTQAFKAKDKKPESPFQRFATLSGEGNPNPLWIKIHVPFSKSSKPIEMPLRKAAEDGRPISAGDAIGLALYKYTEAGIEPTIPSEKMNVNHWVFRMYEDGEVEEDFPPITRTKPIADFTSNNNRPPNRRARDKPWDEFALVQASESEFQDNEKATPMYTKEAHEAMEGSSASSMASTAPSAAISQVSTAPTTPGMEHGPATGIARPFRNPVLGLGFNPTTTYKNAMNPLDAPATPVSHATPRMGAQKSITISFHDDQFNVRRVNIEATTDTYIAEVFEKVCHRLAIDKALFVLKVSGTQTVAPTDRTVEALGDRNELDLVRRRFVTDGAFGLSGSPGSSSPNAPLLISTGGTPKKGKKGARMGGDMIHPLAQKQDALTGGGISTYKRYAVTRKQPMSFSSSSSRILALDGEYMHIMPSETGGGGGNKALFEPQGKTTVVPFSSVVGSKVSRRHPRMFRVVVYKERETKRYDFEASSAGEAQEIVKEIKRAVERFQEGAY
ncbi:hypothetical protein EJ05DRAFT_534689 [Pseudovirgaria hyperparasitica]|uniref:SIN1-domain-containing protein n=1 Tax=Pseudovirgaria hyperparasitica TaxID=470096 RepID=A0A6A6WM95_9PEZI|nr:uncharacterized protein EJ05DRAFT_534689 [Pseudovirgaria hyperparasitica]KAF2763325.1 hypothetical protein EJ05DRAFT_534689 [Pseudovirgaria hyperparasitica]